ncbi:MAG: 3-oxoacyl-[acyl-carrier-protein] synthase [Thermotogaceae bacterium]|jgi:3-oxoacyl-[acyl-carrier-protein] synthase-3|nr:3-oxoacyl-[acyl-carrier-protein] synthase [Thermotogaceae bacterium]MDN5337908.1 3-oxoacyl-[acyl-carrier-protein] synthase [Thermotogaceae bacterium]
MFYAKIISSGLYSPEKIMTNEEFERLTGMKIEPHYSEVLGINHRHISDEKETPAFMAAEAAKRALENAGMKPEDLDLIILGTDTPEAISPPTAPKVQYLIGANKKEVPVFDVNASCANGALLIDIAAKYIASGDYENVMVIGTYAMTKFLSWKYPWEALFSDGAGALILSKSDKPGYIGGVMRADGSWWNNWGIYMGTGKMNIEGIERGLHKLDLRAPYPATVNEEGWPMMIERFLQKYRITKEEIGMIFFTQVRKKSIINVMEKLELPLEKTHMIMEKYGYTGSACVYMAYHDAYENNMLKNLEGKVILFMTSGVGYQQVVSGFRF